MFVQKGWTWVIDCGNCHIQISPTLYIFWREICLKIKKERMNLKHLFSNCWFCDYLPAVYLNTFWSSMMLFQEQSERLPHRKGVNPWNCVFKVFLFKVWLEGNMIIFRMLCVKSCIFSVGLTLVQSPNLFSFTH